MKKINIGIGKLGKSMKIDKWGLVGGDSAPIILYSSLAFLNPQINFYVIGKSDFSKNKNSEIFKKLFPNENVHVIPYENNNYLDGLVYLLENDIKLDAFLLFNGMVSNVNIPNYIDKVRGEGKVKPLFCFQNYAANIITILDDNKNVPLYLISEDPRHPIIKAKDLSNRENYIFSQENADFKIKHITSPEDHTIINSTIKINYDHTEKIFLLGEDENWIDKILNYGKKNTRVSMFLNGHGMNSKDGRYEFVKNWVLDNFPECKVYGNWPKELYETDGRFIKQKMADLKDVLIDTKYTLVNSIKPGFVTCKPFEMLVWGILPFLHPDYDKNNLLDLPKYLYVKDEIDFLEKVIKLEEDEDLYFEILHESLKCIKEEYINGVFLNNKFIGKIYNDLGHEYIDNKNKLDNNIKTSHFK